VTLIFNIDGKGIVLDALSIRFTLVMHGEKCPEWDSKFIQDLHLYKIYQDLVNLVKFLSFYRYYMTLQ